MSNTSIPEEQAMHLEARIATNIKNLLTSHLGKHLIQYLHFVHAFKCQTYVGEIKFGFSMHYYSAQPLSQPNNKTKRTFTSTQVATIHSKSFIISPIILSNMSLNMNGIYSYLPVHTAWYYIQNDNGLPPPTYLPINLVCYFVANIFFFADSRLIGALHIH